MADKTSIEWTDRTFNPWEGCQKVGPGCDHCYAETRNARYGGGIAINWGPGAPRRRTSVSNWKKPLQWNAAHAAFFAEHGRRQRVFCASLADVFDNAVDRAWRMDLFSLIANTPNLDWLILTKRIGNVIPMCSGDGLMFDMICNRVWLGATVVSQEEADRDIPKLLEVPAAKRFLSMEPLLGPVDLLKWLDPWTCADCEFHGSENDCGPDGCDKCGENDAFSSGDVCKNCGADDQSAKPSCPNCGSHRSFERDNGFKFDSERKLIDWVIVGGESGHGARLMHPNWGRSLRDQCQVASVPFLYKQHGEWLPVCDYYSDDDHARDAALDRPYKLITRNGAEWDEEFDGQPPPGTWIMHKVGKKAAGRLLDGREWNEYPLETA